MVNFNIFICHFPVISYNLFIFRSDDEQEEAPVQGPLPLEPDDAPWKRSESGIRKLYDYILIYNVYKTCYLFEAFLFSVCSFRKMFGESNNVLFPKTSPKHSKLSLPKMAVPIGNSSISETPEV